VYHDFFIIFKKFILINFIYHPYLTNPSRLLIALRTSEDVVDDDEGLLLFFDSLIACAADIAALDVVCCV
jgi:hypothetical protein